MDSTDQLTPEEQKTSLEVSRRTALTTVAKLGLGSAGMMAALKPEDHIITHYRDHGHAIARGLDIKAALREAGPETHLYFCGPAPLMAAAMEAARDRPAGTVHYEYFTSVPEPQTAEDRPFRVQLARSGGEYDVRAGETIAEVLQRHGVPIRTSCELGYCGACLTPYLAGEPDHRDQVLEENGRGRYVLICCSRAKSPVLVLDL